MKAINVLSLFDGISTGQLALQKANIPVKNYFASEVDKHAIAITQHNFKNTKQLGDIRKVKGKDLPKIDLLIGGSPCQGFSVAGKMKGFEDERSKLFYEYVRLLKETKPKYFLLENVPMRKADEDRITKLLGVQPRRLNSKLVSAQNRERLYWTNIPDQGLPDDKHIYLHQVVKTAPNTCQVKAFHYKGRKYKDINQTTINRYGTNYITNVNPSGRGITGKVHSVCNNSKLRTMIGGERCSMPKILDGNQVRKITINEAETLQNLPKDYTKATDLSKCQRYKGIANGWTTDMIVHLLKPIKKTKPITYRQKKEGSAVATIATIGILTYLIAQNRA